MTMLKINLPRFTCCLLLFVWLVDSPVFAQRVPTGVTETALSNHVIAHETAAQPPLIERQLFLTDPAVQVAKLSPDGSLVAYLLVEGLQKSLFLLDTNTLGKTFLFRSFQLEDIRWTTDSRNLILDLGKAIGKISAREPESPAYITTLDLANGDYFIGLDHSADNAVLLVRRGGNREHVLMRYTLAGEAEHVLSTPFRIWDALYSADASRAVIVTESDTSPEIYQFQDGQLSLLISCNLPPGNHENCVPLDIDAENNTLWLETDNNENFISLYSYSFSTENLTLIHSDPWQTTDIDGVIMQGRQPVIARYQPGLMTNIGLDANAEHHLGIIQADFPDSEITPQISENNETWLLTETSAVLMHPRYYLYSTSIERIIPILEEERITVPAPAPSDLSPKLPVQYAASDGLVIHGYVSLPKGLDIARAPLIAAPHGGPFGRVRAGYDHIIQFLVNRGYIVFEPNFRVSTGYGRDYVMRGLKDYGNGAIQQDVIDGVKYLLAQGIGDPDQLAIVGISFGGFSVLSGLAFTPDLFKAGIALVPPATMGATIEYQLELRDAVNESPMQIARTKKYIADFDNPGEMARLMAKSPRANLAAIQSPLLIMAGGNDQNVPVSGVKDYTLELLNLGKPISFMLDNALAHGGWPDFETGAMLFLMETFLSQHLNGRKQAMDDPLLRDYLKKNLLINSNTEFLEDLQ